MALVNTFEGGPETKATDAFGRQVIDGWASADIGGAYTIDLGSAADFDVASGVGTVAHPIEDTNHIASLAQSIADGEMLLKVKTDKLAAGADQLTSACFRYQDASNHYLARLEFNPDQTLQLRARKRVAGVDSTIGLDVTPSGTHAAGTFFWLRTRWDTSGTGIRIRIKAWQDGSGEPATWQLDETDATASWASGTVAIRTVLTAGTSNEPVVFSVDSLTVSDILITTANSGGASGDAFDTIVGTPAFSRDDPAHGSTACVIDPPASTSEILRWSALGTQIDEGLRGYYKFSAFPASSLRLMRWRNGSALAGAVLIGTNGAVSIIDSLGVNVATSTQTIPTGARFRLEARLVASASSGSIEVRMFTSPESTTPAWTLTASTINTNTQVTNTDFGQTNTHVTPPGAYQLDSIAAAVAAWPGPFVGTVTLTGVTSPAAIGSPTLSGGGAPPSLLLAGITSRLTGSSSAAEKTSHPELRIISVGLYWKDFEPVKGTFDYGALQTSIADAHNRGYQIFLRFFAGADAPIGRPGTSQPSWLATHPSLPVARVRTFANENSLEWPTRSQGTLEIFVPKPWDANYRTHYADVLREWARWMNSPCPVQASHPVLTHIHSFTASSPTEIGSEVQLGYGEGPTVYTGSATTADQLTFDGAQIPLSLSVSGYPLIAALYKITDGGSQLSGGNDELIVATRSGSTLTVLRRGHSGTNATAHLPGKVVAYAGSNYQLASYDGYPASGTVPYDHVRQNQRAWHDVATGSTFATRETDLRSRVTQAWKDCIDDCMALLPPTVSVSFAGGGIFADGVAGSDDVVQDKAAVYRKRLIAMTTNLRASGSPPLYRNAMPGHDDFLVKAKAAGALIGFQFAGTAVMPHLSDTQQEVIDACEDALTARYTPIFIEVQPGRLDATKLHPTGARGGWPGGAVSQHDYLLQTAIGPGEVNDRIVAPTSPGSGTVLLLGVPSPAAVGEITLPPSSGQIRLDGVPSPAAIGSPLVQQSPSTKILLIGVPSAAAIGEINVQTPPEPPPPPGRGHGRGHGSYVFTRAPRPARRRS